MGAGVGLKGFLAARVRVWHYGGDHQRGPANLVYAVYLNRDITTPLLHLLPARSIMPIFYTGYLKMELSMHKCMQVGACAGSAGWVRPWLGQGVAVHESVGQRRATLGGSCGIQSVHFDWAWRRVKLPVVLLSLVQDVKPEYVAIDDDDEHKVNTSGRRHY